MRALISVSDKAGIVPFAQALHALGYEIISTGGTAKLLKESHIPVIPIDEVTQFPEMLDGRVKTLHPKIHGGLLALRDNPDHMTICRDHHIEMIDMVVVNLYPFEKTIEKPNATLEEAIENIDIGGPSMIRSASKNYRSVAVLVNPDRYTDIIAELKEHRGKLSDKTRAQLAIEAFTHTARYDALISSYLEKHYTPDTKFPAVLTPVLHRKETLRYGENPHQHAAFYELAGQKQRGLSDLEQLNGKELSYNNLVDLEAAWLIVQEFEQSAATIIKHTNPCGTAIASTIETAYQKAHDADPVSAFGSIVGLNKTVNAKAATAISQTFVEAVIAPDYDKDALDILKQKPNLRVIRLPRFHEKSNAPVFKYIQNGFLIQSPDSILTDKSQLTVVTKRQPTANEMADMMMGFAVCKHVKSNAIVVVKDGVSRGVGAGQMSRVEAVEIAIKKAGEHVKGAVVASDAFFPFKDSVELLEKAGVTAIIQPGGSKRDQESIDAADAAQMTMLFTHIRHFKH